MKWISSIVEVNKYFVHIASDKLLREYISHYSISLPSDSFQLLSPILVPDLGGTIIFEFNSSGIDANVFWVTNDIKKVKSTDSILFMIEFNPSGLIRLFKDSHPSYTNLAMPLKELNKEIYLQLFNIFYDSSSVEVLIQQLNHYFCEKLCVDKKISAVVDYIKATHCHSSVKSIADKLYYSPKQVNRMMMNTVGLTAKDYLKTKRLILSLDYLKNKTLTIDEISYQLGFYDTAHFVKTFHELYLVNPTEYRNNMSLFYSEKHKTF
ncbi:helix-turn-helix domain-containing protein [Enterococcus sp. AZ192]|uniref:helix-turn-helix domain-containing protein n=1 Tax=unclassified Enterococcus TaxID=2608891 RepID=UPI003D26DCA6